MPEAAWDASQFAVPTAADRVRFHDLGLPDEIMRAVFDLGFRYCTPIQAEILPHTLAGGDAAGRAQTGTGKTAAFLITIFTHFLRVPVTEKRRPGTPRALILAPTRELAMQITEEARAISKHTSFRTVTVFGGMEYEKQRQQLGRASLDVVVATPGRLIDFHRQHDVHLSKVEILVIDEADRMLDMGFIPDVRRIIQSTPPRHKRQTLLWSATLTPEIMRLASQWTRDPVFVEIEPEQVAVDSVEQVIYIVTTDQKLALLQNIITRQNLTRVIVFCNRRDETRKLADLLSRFSLNLAVLSGEVPQKKRIQTLEDFRSGKIRVLIATDVAGRGIHVEGVSHVINYTLPHDPEDYVHRIGRTGRAGATGVSISFACEEDSFHIPDIEKFIGRELKAVYPEDDWLILPPMPEQQPKLRSRRPVGNRKRGRRDSPPSGKRR